MISARTRMRTYLPVSHPLGERDVVKGAAGIRMAVVKVEEEEGVTCTRANISDLIQIVYIYVKSQSDVFARMHAKVLHRS